MGYRYLNTGTAVPVFAAEPPLATEGSLYYNSTSDIFYISNGTQWNLVSNANPATTGGTRTIDALSEGGTFSYDLGDDFTDDVDTDAQLTYTLASGTLPSGCTLPTTGNSAFTGTASVVSSNTNYTWTIKVTDTSGGTATQDYQQTINTVAPTVTGGTVTIGAVSEAGAMSYDVDTDFTFGTGSTFSAYSLQSGTLPSGTSLNTSTGVISGTAGNVSSNTAYTFTIRGTDTDGDTVDQSYSWTINTITPTSTGGTVTISNTSEGASASYDVDTNFSYPTGSTFSAYSLQSGSLPNGLSLNTTSGVISGTAGNSGSASFTIRATDTDGDVKDQAYSWVINNVVPTSTGGTVTISAVNEGSSASYDVDTNFTFTAGSTFSAYSLLSGSLPSGLSFNTSTGVISGTMGLVASNTAYSFTIRGTDTDGDIADQNYSWSIINVPLSATGGTVTTYSGYKVHTFTSSGTITFNKSGSVDVLVVAGGGGGGESIGGGGGGGGFIASTAVSVTTGSHTVTIGNGGAGHTGGGASPTAPAASGGNSSALSLVAIGGGGGGSRHTNGVSGGSGGGAGGQGGVSQYGGSGTSGQGFKGGDTPANVGDGQNGAGGGGAGVAAANISTPIKPNGASGIQNSFDGTTYWYAGGGGGNSHTNSSAIGAGNGGNGGGGGAGQYSGYPLGYGLGDTNGRNNGTNGDSVTTGTGGYGGVNTGGGGGGGGWLPAGGDGGNGGSGIVVIRYAV